MAGRRSSRSCATGCSRPTRSSTCAGSSRAGSTGRASAPARRWPSSRPTPGSRTRCARRAASPRARSSATWARSPATCSSRRAAGTGGSTSRAACTAATRCHARDGEHREHAIFGNGFCASAHPSDVAAALLALGATLRTTNARAPGRRPLPPADRRRPQPDHARAGRADPRARRPATGASTYLKAMDRQRWSFPIVGVAAARTSGERGSSSRASRRSRGCSTRRKRSTTRRRSRERRTRSRSRRRSSAARSRRSHEAPAPAPAARRAACRVRRQEERQRVRRELDELRDQRGQVEGQPDRPRRRQDVLGRRQDEQGRLHVRPATKTSPCTTASFAGLVDKGFFDGRPSTGSCPGFVIQGGDPDGNGTGGPGYSIVDAPPQDTQYTKGLVAMAKSQNEPAGHLGQPVLRRHGRRRQPAAGLRGPRQGDRRHRRRREDRQARQPGRPVGRADREGHDRQDGAHVG